MKPLKLNITFLILIIILSRSLAFGIFDQWDIVNDSGLAVKPLGQPAYLDYTTYLAHINSAWHEIYRPFSFIQLAWLDPAKALIWLQSQNAKPGPIFSILLGITGFDTLGWVYIFIGCLLGFCWAKFFEWRNLGLGEQVFVACFPALIYYSFLVSTDLLYALLVAIFYATTWSVLLHKKWALIWSVLIMTILLLIRPNALSLIPILLVVIYKDVNLNFFFKFIIFLITGLIGAYMLIYYLPYFWVHEVNSVKTPYWGIYSKEFYEGIFTWLPDWINKTFSFLFLAVSKILYSVGLRPSYSGVSLWLVLARASPAILLLPGLIFALIRAHWFERLFLFFFMIPVYVGATQERYLLAITPLLLFWGIQFYKSILYEYNHRKPAEEPLKNPFKSES